MPLTEEERKERARQRAKAWREANTDKVKAYNKAWYEANADRKKAYNKDWNEANADRKKALDAAYRKANAGKVKAYTAAWREQINEANPGKFTAQCAWSKARRLNLLAPDADQSKIQWLYSVAKALEDQTGEKWHVDHIDPLSNGGLNHENNLQVITATANLSKNGKVGIPASGVTVSLTETMLLASRFM